MSKISEVYYHAATLVEGGWIQGCYARDANGQTTTTIDDDATQFCAVGALMRSVRSEGMDVGDFREFFAQTDFSFNPTKRKDLSLLMLWNDREERTQEEVVQTLKNAAKQWDDNGTE